MEFCIAQGSDPEAERLRETVQNALSSRYDGWDDDYDRQFDAHTVWFALRSEGRYVATCKLIFKTMGVRSIPLPIERGDIRAFAIDASVPGTCEGSGLSFAGRRNILTLVYKMGQWMATQEVGPVYAIVDRQNVLLRRFYSQALGFEFIPGAGVSYSGFRYQGANRPVEWDVLRLPPSHFRAETTYAKLARLEAATV